MLVGCPANVEKGNHPMKFDGFSVDWDCEETTEKIRDETGCEIIEY